MQVDTLTIVGVGLIGGSIGLAAKSRGVARRVIGVGRRNETLDLARKKGAIDESLLELAPAASRSDFVVFCTPVQMIASQVLEAGKSCREGTILTDAGSTKTEIVAALEGKLPQGIHFVGSHPLAGSEKRGPEHASGNLFENRLTVVTPTAGSDPVAVEKVETFWQALGSRVKRMSPQDHDAALAVTSHLPHLLAAALAGSLPAELHELTASGFRDTTRIAAGDPELWTGIFLHNRRAVLDALARVTAEVNRYRDALAAADEGTLKTLLNQARKVRDALGS